MLTSKLENSPESYSEINARKSLYKRVSILLTRFQISFLKMAGLIPLMYRANVRVY